LVFDGEQRQIHHGIFEASDSLAGTRDDDRCDHRLALWAGGARLLC
jgi:hypothetical protein